MGSARIKSVRQRLGLVDRKSISGPVRKDTDKFKSKQKAHAVVRDKGQREFYGDEWQPEQIAPGIDLQAADPALDEMMADTIPASRVEGTSPKPKYILTKDKGGLIEIPTEDSELSEKLRAEGPPETSVPAFNIDAFGATITKPNAERWAKSARIQTARQRLADIFDVIEGGSVERIKRQPNLYLKNGVRMSPKRFLDLASSTGLEETSKRLDPKRWEHNRGVFSDLGDEYTADPSVEAGTPTSGAMWHEGEQYRMPKKFYIIKDKEGNYTQDMHKYIDEKISDDGYYMEGVDEIDFIDEDTPPTTYEGKPMEPWKAYHGLPQHGDTRNKILGTGEDLIGNYATHPGHEIFRGDETGGTVEYFRRLLRRGEGFERPQFSVDAAGNITSHEGRHRARAMFDEDVKDFPVGGDIAGKKIKSYDVKTRKETLSRKKIPLSKIKGEGGSIDRKRADLKVNEALTGNKITIPRKDTRYPILGRYSKSARIQMARERLGGLGFRERILNWLKEQPRFKSFDPDSSFVGGVKYDQDNQSMQITLNGKKYDFCNVEERLFDSFSGAGSKGAFFNREIKSLHNCGAW